MMRAIQHHATSCNIIISLVPVEHLGYLGNSIAGYPGNLGAHMGTSSLGELKVSRDLQPRSITMMEVSFSRLELGATLPKPTLVSVVKMKYILVMYRDCRRRERTKVVSKRLFSERGVGGQGECQTRSMLCNQCNN